MPDELLLFWKTGPHVRLSPDEIARELAWGEEVDGLIDLPVREILDRLKAAFPNHQERTGQLVVLAASGSFDATWTWQHLRVETHELDSGSRERLIDLIEDFGCMAFEPSSSP
jgi:hypothetical protein